jgi:cyclase
MSNLRLIARLDVKAPYLIKGVHLEGLRKLGDPKDFAQRYYADGIDEIIYIDAVASLYERNTIMDLVRHTAENVFIPITAGGGVRSVDDARALLRSGADKIAINTAATKRPELITEMAEHFGSQCMVLSIQAKRQNNGWEAYCDQGREHTGLDAVEWATKGEALGAGEILITSVDMEGTGNGFDLDLIVAIADAVTIPVIASGGMGNIDHLLTLAAQTRVNAVAMAHVLHHHVLKIADIRAAALNAGLGVRTV